MLIDRKTRCVNGLEEGFLPRRRRDAEDLWMEGKTSAPPRICGRKPIRAMLALIVAIGYLLNGSARATGPGLAARIPASEYIALIGLYYSTGGPAWKDHTGWLDPNAYPWHGVSTDGGHVIGLGLTANNLRGSIPSSVGAFSQMQFIYLGQNSLTGPIPATIGNLSQLSILHLGYNQLTGSVPAAIGTLPLSELVLQQNRLTGSIPDPIGSVFLTTLLLNDNQLSGPIPASLGNLGFLTELNLSHNQLSGNIPDSLGNLVGLTQLILHDNQFSGSIPNALGNLTQLTELTLEGNQLSGTIPDSLGNLTLLTSLNLSHNQLSGSIPSSLGNLTALTSLELQYNQLTGPIPTTIANLTLLTELYLDFNHLSGEFPPLGLASPSTIDCDIAYNSLDISPSSETLANVTGLIDSEAKVYYSPQGARIASNGDLVGPYRLLYAGSPTVDSAGDVTFRAILSSTASPTQVTTAVLLYSGTTTTIVASTGTPAPGANGALFATLSDPVLSGSGALAFIGTLKPGGGVRPNSAGVWLYTSGTTTLVARTGQTAPTGAAFPAPVIFSSVDQIGVNDAGGVTLLAGLAGAGIQTMGLFSTDASGNLDLLVYRGKSGQLSAPSFGAFIPLPYVAGQSRSLDTVNGNVTIFGPLESATTSSIAAFAPGTGGFDESLVAETGTAVPGLLGATFHSFDEPAINASGDEAFFATVSGTGINASNAAGIYLASGINSGFIAQAGATAPDPTGTGTAGLFWRFADPVLNNNGAVAFVGVLKPGVDGINWAKQWGIWATTSGTLTEIAQQGSAAPGGGVFAAFDQMVLPDATGPVFLANLWGLPHSEDEGIWADWDGTLTRVVVKGEAIDPHDTVETVTRINIFEVVPGAIGQSRSFDASTGNLAYELGFADGSWAIYEVTPP